MPNGSFARGRRRLAAALWGALAPLAVLAQEGPQPAEGRPKWELGLVGGGGRLVDYPGADQSHMRGIVAPLFIYRGPVLRVDRDGIRGRLARTSDWELDLSASAAFNAQSNDAREGMPGLDYLFGIGPQLIYKGLRQWPGSPTLHLNARAVMSTDFRHFDRRGFVFDPELRWSTERVAGWPAQLSFGVQPAWASRELNRYFYEVAPSQAQAGRPAWAARAGYMGTEFKLTLSRRHSESVSWFVALRGLSLHGAANEGSPLLRDKTNLSVGAGLLWTPWRSQERAVD